MCGWNSTKSALLKALKASRLLSTLLMLVTLATIALSS